MNDNNPEFSQPSYSITVPENSAKNIMLVKIHAFDHDEGENGQVKYSLENSSMFMIDSNSGMVSTSKSLDREFRSVHNLTVRASDRGTPVLSTFVNVIVMVTD
ncbi:unnamed protein product, partial [Meganyctiphanes norvegica]